MGQQPQRTASGESSQSFIRLAANKKCPSCNKDLPLQAFYTAGRSKAGHTRLHSHCKRCKLHRESRRRCVKALRAESLDSDASTTDFPSTLPPSRGHLNRVPEHHSGTKLCTSCQQTKPLSSFYTAGRHKGGAIRWHSHCKNCKLEHEAAQRMQPRRDSRELRKTDEGLTANPTSEQSVPQAPAGFPQHPHAAGLPSPMVLQHVPPYLNPQQLQSMMLLNQHPAMFRNPVLQSQLAMLMWSQMQHPQVPLWALPQPANVIQPAPAQQQPHSMAAQSASTHQPSNAGASFEPLRSAPSLECNSSGGSNDSGCMQAPHNDTSNAHQSPSPEDKAPRSAFDSSSRFAEDSDSAVTWAGKAEQQAQQPLGFRSHSVSHPEAQGLQSGQHSGKDLSSSHLADAAHWRLSESPAAEPATAADSKRAADPITATQEPSQPASALALAQAFPHIVHQAAAASSQDLQRKARSSLLADLRQAQQQQRQLQQLPAQLPQDPLSTSYPPDSTDQQAQNLKRSSRQAAKAAEQAIQAAQAFLSPQQQQPPQRAQQAQQHWSAEDDSTADPLLQWGTQRRAVRARGHRHPAMKAGLLLPHAAAAKPSLKATNAGVTKPALRQAAPGLHIPLFRQPAPVFAATAATAPSAARSQAGSDAVTVTDEMCRQVQRPMQGLLAQGSARQPSGDVVPAFTPRHSRKKGKVQRSAFE